ncbi:MAG TPA: amidohydrolase, partial [Nitrososphaerales archaeon]|nr:amidohydrolase [Nitrososphaerales archaeon]
MYVDRGVIDRISDSPTQDVPSGTTRIDGRGGSLFPGFTDTHCHPFELGWLKANIDLRGTANITGIRLRLLSAVQRARPGEWVRGRGWDHESFPDRRLPSREDIDDITAENPVALTRVCGHISLLNSRAIQHLGLEGRQGVGYDRGTGGRLTGIVREGAQDEAFSKMPARGAQNCLSDLLSIELEAVRGGLTTLHCVLSEDGFKEELEALALSATDESRLLRYRVFIPAGAIRYFAESPLRRRLSGDVIRVNGVKVYADGSLGASTAALREPYADDPSNSGVLRHTDEELAEVVDVADREGHQVIVHAIGDRAVEQAIGALARVSGGGNPRRHRIEHASLLPMDLRSKMKRHGIRATVQPCFITSDTWAPLRLGEERVNDLYPIRSMLEDGIVASGSSDAPVETISPVRGMWAAMTRAGY